MNLRTVILALFVSLFLAGGALVPDAPRKPLDIEQARKSIAAALKPSKPLKPR